LSRIVSFDFLSTGTISNKQTDVMDADTVKATESVSEFLVRIEIKNPEAEKMLISSGYNSLGKLKRAPPKPKQLEKFGFSVFECNMILQECAPRGENWNIDSRIANKLKEMIGYRTPATLLHERLAMALRSILGTTETNLFKLIHLALSKGNLILDELQYLYALNPSLVISIIQVWMLTVPFL
jgi:hypothetical protein